MKFKLIKKKLKYCSHVPTTSSRISFHFISWVGSWTIVKRIRLCIPWWSINKPLQGRSSLCSTTVGTYSPLGASSQISNHTKMSSFANTVDDNEDGHGNEPNFELRTGWLIGMLGGSIRRGGGRVWKSCLAILWSGWRW